MTKLVLPSKAYQVKGNMVTVRRQKRVHGDELPVGPYRAPGTKGGWSPHVGQLPIWMEEDAHQLFMIAGTQGGKSNIGPPWLHREILRAVAKRPGQDSAFGIVTPTFRMAMQLDVGISRMLQFYRQVYGFSEDIIFRKKYLTIDLHEVGIPAFIYAGSAERPRALQGSRLEAVWMDEAGMIPKPAIFYETSQRLRGEGRMLVTTTPYLVGAWLMDFMKKAEEGDEDILCVRYPSIVNPFYSLAQWEMAKHQWPAWYFNQRCGAMFEQPHGLVYPDVTYVDPFTIPRNWKRILGIDPTHGGPDEFAGVWIAIDPNTGTWYIYRTFYKSCRPPPTALDTTVRLPSDMLDEIHKMCVYDEWNEDMQQMDQTEDREKLDRIFYDPSAPWLELSLQTMFSDTENFKADPQHAGIIEVGRAFKTQQLVVFDNLIDYHHEQTHYAYPVNEYGETEKDEPKDSFNHLMDATRYAVRQSNEARNLAGFSVG